MRKMEVFTSANKQIVEDFKKQLGDRVIATEYHITGEISILYWVDESSEGKCSEMEITY